MTAGDTGDRAPMPADVLAIVSSWAGPDPEGEAGARPEALNDPWHTAIHEAGHAVVGRVLGLDMGQASVAADGDSAGHCIVGDPWATLDRWWREWRAHREFRSVIRARAVMLMAGAEAELAILGRLQDVDGESGDGEDRRQADLVMEHDPGDAAGRPARLASLRRAARRLVCHHRVAIEAVAAELRDLGTVPGADLDAMVPGPPPREPDPAWLALVDGEAQGEVVKLSALVRAKR